VRVLRREWFEVSRGDTWTIVPLGDIHIGSVACDEALLQEAITRIRHDDRALWIGMGDYCEWINVKDKRFDYGTLAKWIDISDIGDLAKAQRDRLLDLLRPIADKCLGMIKGNHEDTIQRWTERDVYAGLVAEIKDAGGFEPDYQLGLGWNGWLSLHFYRASTRNRGTWLKIYCHHGNVGGRLRGAKALRMERALWARNADLIIYGHSHNADAMSVTTEDIDNKGNLLTPVRKGMYSGTFLRTTNEDGPATYAERREYYPIPAIGGPVVQLQPGAKMQHKRIRIMV
jgi:predicted phosphodiesterase